MIVIQDHKPTWPEDFERIKRELARRHADDIDAYDAIKDPTYDLIWVAAQAWIRRTGRGYSPRRSQ